MRVHVLVVRLGLRCHSNVGCVLWLYYKCVRGRGGTHTFWLFPWVFILMCGFLCPHLLVVQYFVFPSTT